MYIVKLADKHIKPSNFKLIALFTISLALFVSSSFAVAKENLQQVLTSNNKEIKMTEFDYKNQPDAFWKKKLDSETYKICIARGTERAGTGRYDKFYEEGTYYCACCGGDFPLFSSSSKFDSQTGWPSFWEPIAKDNIFLKKDYRLANLFLGARIEVVCSRYDSHLGHVFDDGPQEHGGKRYCINSLALSFTPEGEEVKRTFSVDD